MNRSLDAWLPPIVALGVLAAAATQVVSALGVTGAFGLQTAAVRVDVPPAYLAVERSLDRRDAPLPDADVQDPFAARITRAQAAAMAARNAPRRAPEPPVPVSPVLTAIVWDSDPRALVRWKDREWTIREGGLFDEFQVVSITRDQVSLRRGEATLVLQRRNHGD